MLKAIITYITKKIQQTSEYSKKKKSRLTDIENKLAVTKAGRKGNVEVKEWAVQTNIHFVCMHTKPCV